MMSKWYQFWVTHKEDAVQVMKRCEPVLMDFGSIPAAPDGVPIQEMDGSIEMRSYNEAGFRMSKRYLEEQGFIVEREQCNE